MSKGLQPRRGDIFMADLSRDPLTKRSGIRPVLISQKTARDSKTRKYDHRYGHIVYLRSFSYPPLTKRSGIRPVLIVQNDYGNVNSGSVIAVVVTSSPKKLLPPLPSKKEVISS